MSSFKRVVRANRPLRAAIIAQAGCGKTLTALKIARGLVGPEGRIAFIDTEHRTASLYGLRSTETEERPNEGRFLFDHLDLAEYMASSYPESPYSVEKYMAALKEVAAEKYDAVIIDSLSHAWAGPGGVLDAVEDFATEKRINSYMAWSHGSKIQAELMNQILSFTDTHVIVTMRSKMEYMALQDDSGKIKSITKVGMGAVQRKDAIYEFDFVLEGEDIHRNTFRVTKSRFISIGEGRVFEKPGADLAVVIREALSDLDPAVSDKGDASQAAMSDEQVSEAVAKGREMTGRLVSDMQAKGWTVDVNRGDTGVTVSLLERLSGEGLTKTLAYADVPAGESEEHTFLRAKATLLSELSKSFALQLAKKKIGG